MQFLSSRTGITKILIVILIFIIASAALPISYYAITYHLSKSSSQTPTGAPEPTVSPTSNSFHSTPTPTPTPVAASPSKGASNPTPISSPSDLTTQESIRNSVMDFIKSNHPETKQFMNNLVWTGGRVTLPNIVGAETYMYYSQGWNVTIRYPVVPNAIYNIMADYSTQSIGIPYRIIWQGTWQNELINETSYVFAQ